MRNSPDEQVPYAVVFTTRAERQLAKLPRDTRIAIMDAAERLHDWPNHHTDVRKLKGSDDEWAQRVGSWRSRFIVDDELRRILIRDVGPRHNVYKRCCTSLYARRRPGG